MSGFFSKFRKSAKPEEPVQVTAGQRVYCVGDIHGMAGLLEQLHTMIRSDAAAYKGIKTIVYLGDYIDRGEHSRQVIDILLGEPLAGFESVYLRGNHEQTMLDFIVRPVETASWMSFGGRETLASYGIPVAHIPTLQSIPLLASQLDQNLPLEHRSFFENCANDWRCGDYYFVHAGIRPGVALERQKLEDKLWIRDEFKQSKREHGAVIVHGHSITPEVEMMPNRIGIDTGAFATGVLTCLVLEGSKQRLLQTGVGHE